MLLRYPYEVRDSSEYFDDIQDVKITKDMLDLAKHIVEQKSGHFAPQNFEDHYELALSELLAKKQKGFGVAAAPRLIVYPISVALTVIVAILGAYPLRRLVNIRPATVFRGEA